MTPSRTRPRTPFRLRAGTRPTTAGVPRLVLLVGWCLAAAVIGCPPTAAGVTGAAGAAGVVGAAGAPAAGGTDPVGVWPLRPEPAVVHGFDPPDSPYGVGHRGVDLAGAVGQPVVAALPGTVTYAGSLAGRGVVVVSHGATRTTYEPVAASVAVGAGVAAGAPLGTLELAGSHCFPAACLHWGWIAGTTYLDPLRLVGLGPVRLLPLWRDDPASAPGPIVGPVVGPVAKPVIGPVSGPVAGTGAAASAPLRAASQDAWLAALLCPGAWDQARGWACW